MSHVAHLHLSAKLLLTTFPSCDYISPRSVFSSSCCSLSSLSVGDDSIISIDDGGIIAAANSARNLGRESTFSAFNCPPESCFGLRGCFGWIQRLPNMMSVPAPPRARIAAHACVQDVVRDMGNIGTYIQAQVSAGRPLNTVLGVQADAVRQRLQNLGAVDIERGRLLTLAVADGPWDAAQKQSMSRTIDDLVAAHARVAPLARRCLQHLPEPENTMLEAEWRSLRTQGPILHAKIAQVAARMWSIGLTCPGETTSCKFAGIICVCCGIADPDEQRDVFERLKAAVKGLDEKRTYPYGHLREYPPDVADWPEDMVTYAYGGERPMAVSMPELDVVMMGTNLRGRGGSARKKGFLRGLQAIKETAESCGVDIGIGLGRDIKNARASLDQRIGYTGGAGSALALTGGAGSAQALQADSAPPLQAASALASTTLTTFKPHLALPSLQEAGATAPPQTAEENTTAVERMMREAGVPINPVKKGHVSWRRRITGKKGIMGEPAAAGGAAARARPAAAVRARPAAAGGAAGQARRRLGCSKCRYLPKGCAQCRNPLYRPRVKK